MMKTSQIAIMAIFLLSIGGLSTITGEAASTYSKSTIVGIDQVQRTITFRTSDGQTMTLPVSEPSVLKQEEIAKGDQVSLEIDLGNRVTKITKLSQPHRSGEAAPQNDFRP